MSIAGERSDFGDGRVDPGEPGRNVDIPAVTTGCDCCRTKQRFAVGTLSASSVLTDASLGGRELGHGSGRFVSSEDRDGVAAGPT